MATSTEINVDALNHIPDATPTEWTKAEQVLRDLAGNEHADFLDAALVMAGFIPDPQPGKARTKDGKTKPDRGRCGVCKRRVNVALDGRLHKHTTKEHGDVHCDGSYGTPVAEGKVE
jgi:hypothetical protein